MPFQLEMPVYTHVLNGLFGPYFGLHRVQNLKTNFQLVVVILIQLMEQD